VLSANATWPAARFGVPADVLQHPLDQTFRRSLRHLDANLGTGRGYVEEDAVCSDNLRSRSREAAL
jgi:hypothetical protein